MDVLMTRQGALGVRVVTMMRMVVMVSGLERGREEQLGMNMRMVATGMGVVERGDLWLEKKTQERRKNR